MASSVISARATVGDVPKGPAIRKNGRATALPPEQRRELIVSTSLPLLLRRGPSVTTREIAEAAGIAEGTIFRIFPDKESLIEAVIEKALDPAPLEAALSEIDAGLPLEQRLARAVRLLQERVVGVWQLISIVGVRPPKEHGRRPRSLGDLHALAALFEPDRDGLRFDPSASARRLRALTIAATHPMLTAGKVLSANEIVSLFLDGARRTPGGRSTARPTARTSGATGDAGGRRHRPSPIER